MFYGGWVAVLPAVVMDYFGGRNVSGIIGILYTSVAFGTLIGPTRRRLRLRFQPQLYGLPILASVAANIVAAAHRGGDIDGGRAADAGQPGGMSSPPFHDGGNLSLTQLPNAVSITAT